MRAPASLLLRLSLAGALVTALASAALGTYLYHSFEAQLQRRDDIQLLGKLRQLRQLLSHSGTSDLLRDQADYLRDTMSGESNALIEIRALPAQGGALLLAINPPGLALPQAPQLPLDQPAEQATLQRWQLPDGTPAAGLAAQAQLGAGVGAQVVQIRLARLYPEREALLAAYRQRIALSSLATGLASGGLLMLMIWWGLAALRRLREQTGQIGPQSLGLRLSDQAAPAELAALVRSVNAMLARIEQGYAQLNQFAADLAHELRTPLATLTGQTQVMLSRPRNVADYAQGLEAQLAELERLNRLVDSVLFLARSEHQALAGALPCQALCAAHELDRQCDYFSDLAEEQGLRLLRHGDAPLWAEPQLLRRALANLMTNALRYAQPDSTIELRASTDMARPGAAGGARLEVINQGEALPPEVMARLFDRFYRGDAARSAASGGSGLGLALVRSIMQLHGGEASVQTLADGRLCFALYFPPAPTVPPVAPASSLGA